MDNIPTVVISGSGKYMLVSLRKGTEKKLLLRGGGEFKMHKDIITALVIAYNANFSVQPEGGGQIFFEEIGTKRILVSGESMKYGPPTSQEAVRELLFLKYPEYQIIVS